MDAITTVPSRRRFLGLAGAALLWPGIGRAAAGSAIEGRAFGTGWRVDGPAGAGLDRLRPGLDALFAGIDREMSPWRPDSALSRFNAAPAGDHPAGDEMLAVTAAALALARDSGGAFDPTVGPLVARWGFGPIAGAARPDWSGLRAGGGRIGKARDGVTLDLCGIAKGRALDRAAALAATAGHDGLLLDIGGELRALGRHPSGRAWQVAVESPHPLQAPAAVLRLEPGQAVATSGVRAQSYRLGGRTYGHIIDPATGAPADGGLLSVTVLAADAMTADGWATALFAAGAGAGPALARRRRIAALFLVDGGAAAPRPVLTGAMTDAVL